MISVGRRCPNGLIRGVSLGDFVFCSRLTAFVFIVFDIVSRFLKMTLFYCFAESIGLCRMILIMFSFPISEKVARQTLILLDLATKLLSWH